MPASASPGARLPGITFVQEPVVNPENPLRHDPERLATALMKLHRTYYRSDGGLLSADRPGHSDNGVEELVGR